MFKRHLSSLLVVPVLFISVIGLCLTPKTASAQNWTLSGTHIYNNNVGYVGIGITAPQSTLHMSDGNAVNGLLGLNTSNFVLSNEGGTVGMQGIVASSGAAGHRMNFEGIRARGTLATPTVPQLDDRVFTLTGKIFDGSGVQNTAQVTFFVDGTVSAGVAPQRISFRTGPTGTASKTENLLIKSTGEVLIPNTAGIGMSTAPGGLLGLKDVNTYLDVDGSNNLIFTDAVTGTKTLAELATDTVDDADASSTNELQNLFATINSDSGSITADIQTDTLSIVGSGTVSTSVTGDTLTITGSGGGVTLDGAYDFGGAGAGRTITADSGAVTVAGEDGFLSTGTFGSGTIPDEGTGVRMMWYPGKAAFRAGSTNDTRWDDENIGDYSVAMGFRTIASGYISTAMGMATTAFGDYSTAMGSGTTANQWTSTAMGYYTTASGDISTAMGRNTTASGVVSTALGYYTTANGDYSTAKGYWTTASGNTSTAMGNNTTASGNNSTAMGRRASTNGMNGSFVYGDNSSGTLTASATNQFSVKASGGYRFFTNSGMTVGAQLAAGANSWTTISDVNLKENFKPIDGEEVLDKIANFKPTTWNYKSQEPGKFRHYGPMAQDFYAAFGNDGIGIIGDDTSIATADLMGVNFTAINALENRTREQAELVEQQAAENKALKTEMETQKAEMQAQQKEMEAVKARLADIEVLLNTR